jgi:phospholipid transport system substrate-binding protein
MKKLMRSLGLSCLLLLSGLVFAAQEDPSQVLHRVTNVILKNLTDHKTLYHNEHDQLVAMINKELVPYVATHELSQNVVGLHYWQHASELEQKEFIDLFVKMVVQVYAGAMTSYSNQTIKYLPLRNFDPSKKVAYVRSMIIPSGADQNILISYQMIRSDGQWKVLDFSVNGVSLTNNYHSQFSDVLANEGMAMLLKQMRKKIEG